MAEENAGSSKPPDSVLDLSPEDQVEWFEEHEVPPMPHAEWALFYVNSTLHKGLCCSSCIEDANEGYQDWDADKCCCLALLHEVEGGAGGGSGTSLFVALNPSRPQPRW